MENKRLSWFLKMVLLLSGAFVGLLIVGMGVILLYGPDLSSKSAQITTMVGQNIVVFVLPMLLLALFLKKTEGSPVAKTMWMSKAPTFKSLLLIVLVWIVALPAMNYIVEWNNNLHLPASLKDIEQYLREMEDSAQAVTSSLLSTKSWGMMIMMVVVVALLTALGEETFFRAGLLGSMHTGKVNRHVAVWTVAILFSAFHMQFYGFVPRMLLGAWFGYVMLWCGEVWTPMIGHALNNGMVVIMTFLADQHIIGENYLDKLGNENHWLALGSAVLTAIVIIVFMRKRNTNETTTL